MDRAKIFQEVQTVFNLVLEEDNVKIKESYNNEDVEGWDSLTHIMLIVEIEKKFKLNFLSSEISEWKDIGEMIDCIEEKINK